MYEVPFVFSKSSLTEPSFTGDSNNSDYKFSEYYINETSSDITIVRRNNLPILVNKALGSNRDKKQIIIKNVFTFRSNEQIVATINNITEYQKTYDNKQEDLENIKKILLLNYNTDRFCSNISVVIDYPINIATIKENNVIYVPNLDLLISLGTFNVTYPHPFSQEGSAMTDYTKLIKDKKVSGMFIELIDNENNIKNRYMYVAKQLLEIPVRKDKNRESGVYFTRAIYDRLDDVHIKPEYYGYDKAESELGIYKTKEEATTGGNPETISKKELINKEQELIDAKHKLSMNDMVNKEKISSLEVEIENLKKRNAVLKEEFEHKKVEIETKSMERKDHYEERSVVRKDNQEFIKYAPAVITGMIAMFAIYNSSKSSK